MSEQSEKETMDAGRWQKPENLFRYLRGIDIGKGAVARLLIPLEENPEESPEENPEESPEENPEEGPADLSSEM